MKPNYYIASCSFGKDSIATILQALIRNEPLDEIIFCEVKFDDYISGEAPEHIEFIKKVAIPKLEKLGVKKITIVQSKKNYVDCFYHINKKGERAGKYQGFPLAKKCKIKSELKIAPIKRYISKLKDKYNVIEYIGICADENNRFKQLKNNKISLLVKYGLTQYDTRNICISNGLYSPVYNYSTRQGCWFFPNCKYSYFAHIKEKHSLLWDHLVFLSKVPNTISNYFRYDETFKDVEFKVDRIIRDKYEFPEMTFE